MGAWGVRWLVPNKRPSEIDPDGLMQWIRRHVILRELPTDRVVIRFELVGRFRRYFWLIMRAGEASLCPSTPGSMRTCSYGRTRSTCTGWWRGGGASRRRCDEGTVQVDGPPVLVRSLPRWFLLRASGPPIDSRFLAGVDPQSTTSLVWIAVLHVSALLCA